MSGRLHIVIFSETDKLALKSLVTENMKKQVAKAD